MRNVGPGMGANVPVTGPNGGTAAPGAAAPAPTATLPPERILFAGTATSLKLIANRPAIFALYALPHPHATPAPSAAATSAGSTAAPTPAAPATPSASKAP